MSIYPGGNHYPKKQKPDPKFTPVHHDAHTVRRLIRILRQAVEWYGPQADRPDGQPAWIREAEAAIRKAEDMTIYWRE